MDEIKKMDKASTALQCRFGRVGTNRRPPDIGSSFAIKLSFTLSLHQPSRHHNIIDNTHSTHHLKYVHRTDLQQDPIPIKPCLPHGSQKHGLLSQNLLLHRGLKQSLEMLRLHMLVRCIAVFVPLSIIIM